MVLNMTFGIILCGILLYELTLTTRIFTPSCLSLYPVVLQLVVECIGIAGAEMSTPLSWELLVV